MIKPKHHPALLALLSIISGIQLTIVCMRLLTLFPPLSPITTMVLPEWQSLLRPEWDVFIYRFFIASVIANMIFWLCWSGKIVHMWRYIMVESFLTALMLGANFKMVVYAAHSELATQFLNVICIAAFLSKVGWPWVDKRIDWFKTFIFDRTNAIFLNRLSMFFMPIVIFLIIDVPNIPHVIARFFVGEQFHHNDSFIFGPGWAYVSGARLDFDVISQYGVGIGAIFGTLGQLMGGFTYESGLQMMIWGAIIYYIIWFFLMRAWIGSTLLAATGVFLVLKFQLFNAGVYPFAFTYGSATIIRNWFDIFVMVAIWLHIIKPRTLWLVLAACTCGFQLFYIPSDGVYLLAMFTFYLLCAAWLKGGFKYFSYLCLLCISPLVMFLLMWIFIGPVVWQKIFWNNTQEFVAYFINGFGLTPIYSGLQARQFLASLMGFVLPTVYVLTLLIVGTLLVLKKINSRNVFVCVIAVYGLCLYHYYVARSGPSSYYVVSLPFVMLLVFWLAKLTKPWMRLAFFVCSVLALGFNQNFLSYPNRLNLSANPLTDTKVAQPLDSGLPYFHHLYREYNEQLKVSKNTVGDNNEALYAENNFISDDQLLAYYKAESDFSIDALLIDRLTKPEEPVFVISSFEIKMLMDAKRRPYIYYFPLTISHPLHSTTLLRSSIYTVDQLNKVTTKLAEDKPKYIFIERILLTRPLSQAFYYYYSSMLYLTDIILKNYEPKEQGKYLVVLKLKGLE